MARTFIAVAGGYAAMTLLVLAALYMLDFAVPDEFRDAEGAMRFPDGKWVALILGASFIAAVGGGFTTFKLAVERQPRHVSMLAMLVLVLGIFQLFGEDHGQPLWYLLLLPVIGTLGVYIGGHYAARSAAQSG